VKKCSGQVILAVSISSRWSWLKVLAVAGRRRAQNRSNALSKDHPMKSTRYACLLCILLFCLTSPAGAQPNRDEVSPVDAYIAETMRRLPIRGMSIAIVQGDQVLYLRGYGTANAAGDPVTPQTPFMLASVTKTFTALAVQQLAAAGLLDLDAPVQTLLPEFHLADEQMAAAMTIRHLLDHKSGISTLEGTQPYLHAPETQFEEAVRRLAGYTPAHLPGRQHEYSNWNYVLLGKIIERASGQTYAAYMQRHILDPLHMGRATFADHHTLPDAATGNLIVFGVPVPYDEKHVPVMLSAGYLTASAEDMAQYLIPYLNQGQYQGEQLLPAQGRGWYDASWNWKPGAPPDISCGHAGGHNSFSTSFIIFPRHQVGVVVLMNTRLDSLIAGPTANDIAFNLARLTIEMPYELPSNQQFYTGYAVLDSILLLLIASIGWQAAKLRGWRARVRDGRVAAWLGIASNLLVCLAILVLPGLAGTNWTTLFYHRPETGLPFLCIFLSLGGLAMYKITLALLKPHP
jgi:CubicO group peptidase (beta-lactamase class C family)